MDVTQFYETRIVDRDSGIKAHIFSVPTRAFEPDNKEFVLQEFGIAARNFPVRYIETTFALASCLSQRYVEPFEREEFYYPSERYRYFEEEYSPYLQFAEYLMMARLIPFEESPLGSASIGNIIASGSGGAIGLYVGIALAGGPTPLLVITVPAGIVIVGAATGIAEGLQNGLRERITNAIVRSSDDSEPPS